MSKATSWASEQVREDESQMEKRLRRVFLGSLVMCSLIVWALLMVPAYAAQSPHIVRACMLPLLLWALVVTIYAFQSLWLIANERKVKLQEMAQRDSLTGAFTDEHMFHKLEEERQKAMSSGQAAVVGFVRIVGLEDVNVNFGHAAGNLVLRELAESMRQTMPPGGMLGRLCGPEFVLYMPKTALQEGEALMRRIRKAICDYQLDLGKRGMIGGMEASVGLAAFPVDGETPADIVHAAQQKLLVDA